MDKKYQVELHFGYQETESGIFHAFEAADPEKRVDVDEMREKLAKRLCTTVMDDGFNFNFMNVLLPDSLVKRIKKDAVKDFVKRIKKEAETQ